MIFRILAKIALFAASEFEKAAAEKAPRLSLRDKIAARKRQKALQMLESAFPGSAALLQAAIQPMPLSAAPAPLAAPSADIAPEAPSAPLAAPAPAPAAPSLPPAKPAPSRPNAPSPQPNSLPSLQGAKEREIPCLELREGHIFLHPKIGPCLILSAAAPLGEWINISYAPLAAPQQKSMGRINAGGRCRIAIPQGSPAPKAAPSQDAPSAAPKARQAAPKRPSSKIEGLELRIPDGLRDQILAQNLLASRPALSAAWNSGIQRKWLHIGLASKPAAREFIEALKEAAKSAPGSRAACIAKLSEEARAAL